MPLGGHEGGLRLVHIGVMGDVFPCGGEGVAEALQHGRNLAVGGGLMGEVTVVPHVGRLDAGNAAQLRIQGQGAKTVVISVLIEQICHLLLLR